MSSRCETPFRLKTGEYVPCGECVNCKARRISGWSFRLMMEERYCSSAQFLTLTYAPENVSKSPLGGRLTLDKSHVQCFIKKLRRRSNWGNSVKYFAVGEYGTAFSRPHYHLLLFNAHIEDVQPCWQFGQIYYGTVSGASVGYCLKYMCKERKIPQYKGDDRLPEFGLFSKGLGISYITPETIQWHKDDLLSRMYVPLEGGQKVAMPRYFKEKIYTKAERMRIQLAMVVRQEKIYKETYRSTSPSVRLKSFIDLRNRMESFNAESRKMRRDYYRSKTSIF